LQFVLKSTTGITFSYNGLRGDDDDDFSHLNAMAWNYKQCDIVMQCGYWRSTYGDGSIRQLKEILFSSV